MIVLFSSSTKMNMENGENKKSGDFFSEAQKSIESIKKSEKAKTQARDLEELEKSRHRINKLEILINVTKALNSTLNLNELLAKIIDSIINLADTDRGFLMLADSKGEMKFRIARDKNEQSLEERDFEVSYSIINEVTRKGAPLFISDLMEDEQFAKKESVIDLQLRTAICVPLKLDNRIIGVIYTDASRLSGEITEDDISIVSAFSAQAAIAIENARLHGALILSKEDLARENRKLKQELSDKYEFSGIIGKSKPMLDIFSTIKKIALFDTTVLITGSTGTGKELIAKAIHYNSERKDDKLVTINCSAMPAELLESELFGHKKGSFTGASNDKPGLFETASGGTIFLDEIGDMPETLQVKLLRTLQEGEIRRVGENLTRKVNVRIIAATNRDLEADAEKGGFRRDLFYRLNVVPIKIPPLCDRQEDILPLVAHFLDRYSKKMNKGEVTISPEVTKLFLSYKWPGNVRELENSIERALALSGDSRMLNKEHFPQFTGEMKTSGREGYSLKQGLKSAEKKIIEDALSKTGGKVTKAAELLKVSRQHLHNKINEYNINR
ncbi:MAG TPA: sigma 54-interacting transcriptional regulator [Candidatus Krumholzibacteriaceae bacterium]|nr:sigma 54-interacting transcriptional regulator [Candidatus Krumholzibacteriaceae bacterium]